ncbi:MAG: MG2 domain-containing protein [Myxococcota bacterium]
MKRHLRGAIRSRWLWMILGLGALGLLIASTQTCLRTGFSYGLWIDECPDGDVRQTIHVDSTGLTRGAWQHLSVGVTAHYTVDDSERVSTAALSRFTPTVALVTAQGETLLSPKEGWKSSGDVMTAEVQLPKVNDGEYTLRTRVTSALGEAQLDVPLPLFAPARIHVLTDRPLYEPGNTVRFRALALKGDDLSPLEERPGTWRVVDPSGTVLLEEKAPSGKWGVVAGSFPLDLGAESGVWSVTWASGNDSQTRTFDVRPFTLPRFRVEAAAGKPWYRRGERPVVKGTVRYASGAPVAGAKLQARWSTQGEWPPPTSWTNGSALPKQATTTKDGAFTLELPQVPQDLQGQATLVARLDAVDAAGDRVEGSASVLLSQDDIAVSAVTELADGLVEGFNNKVFVRATTPDGQVLSGVVLNVKRLWEPTDKGTDAEVDEDGVASLQLDPGPPVNVVIPAMPFRPPPPTPPVQRQSLEELLDLSEAGEVSLADRLSFDRVQARVGECARYVSDAGSSAIAGLLVRSSGAVAQISTPGGRLGACLEGALKGIRFEAGRERFFQVRYGFDDDDLPRFEAEVQGVPIVPPGLQERLADALLDARDCLPANVRTGQLPRLLQWKVGPDRRRAELTWVPIKGDAFAEGALACVTSRVKSLTLPKPGGDEAQEEEEALGEAIGTAFVQVIAPEKYESIRPQDTVMVGYELQVTAKQKGEVLGRTTLRLNPGTVPSIRLRAKSQLVRPSESVTVEVLRGPDFTGELPEKLYLRHAYQSVEAKLDPQTRSAQFQVPADWHGWAGVEWGGGQVLFFVQPQAPLTVAVKPEKERYAPGQVAQLDVRTAEGGRGGPAAVGLFGVDDSLSQLVPLPGADELASLRPQATGTAAFGSLDAQALSLGRIRGANAAAATLVRVSALPPPPTVEASVRVHGATQFDPNEALVDRFYAVLGELYAQERAWEAGAPATEKLTPQVMARLWSQALGAVEAKKESARDAFGRRLRLHRLPADLLALTDPRSVVVNGTRLPEDVQNWPQWVAKEKP